MLDAHLQSVVARASAILRDTNDAHPKIGPQCIRIDPWVGLQRSRQQLIDVALALIVQSAAADIANLHGGSAEDLALESAVPFPGGGNLEHGVLNRLREGKCPLRGAAGNIHDAVHHRFLKSETEHCRRARYRD